MVYLGRRKTNWVVVLGISDTLCFVKNKKEHLESPKKRLLILGFGVYASLHLLTGAWNWYLFTDFRLFLSPWKGIEHHIHICCTLWDLTNAHELLPFKSSKGLLMTLKTWQHSCLQTNLLYSVVINLKLDLSNSCFIKQEGYIDSESR